MRSPLARLGLVAVAFVGAALLVPALTRAEPAAGAAPVASVKDLMNAFNHKSYGLFGLVKATLATAEPAANDLKVAAFRATALAECGNLLLALVPPRGCEDDAGKVKWGEHATGFRDAAKELAKLIKTKKLEEAKAQLAELDKRCEACHADHQLE